MAREVRKLVGMEVATTRDGRDITRGYVDALPWLPPTDRVLPLAGGWRGYEEVLRDDQVAACFAQRRLAVVGRPWTVSPGGERRIDRQAADLVRQTLDRIAWDEITDQMLYARFFGFAVAEVMWRADSSGISIESLRVRDRARFAFAPDRALLLRTMGNPNGERVPDRKFWVVAVGASHHDEPYGRGIAHSLYWPVWFKRAGARFWAQFLEKFGGPTSIGKFPAGTSAPDRQKLLDAVAAVQTESGVILPEGMSIELLEASRGGTASYEQWMSYWDRAIAKVCLGQTMTTEDGSSRSQAEVHLGVRDDIVRADSDLVCASANRSWVRWLIDVALPGAAYPQLWREIEEPEDVDRRADRDLKLYQMGFRPTLETVLETYGPGYEPVTPGRPAAPDEGEIFAAAQRASGAFLTETERRDAQFAREALLRHATGRRCLTHGVVHAAERSAEPTVDALIADRLEIETASVWREVAVAVEAIVERAESLEQLRDELLAAFGSLPSERLADVMAMAFASANLAGRIDAGGEDG
jgi:phage gp29-like protein